MSATTNTETYPHRWLKAEPPNNVENVKDTAKNSLQQALSEWFSLILTRLLNGTVTFVGVSSVRAAIEPTDEVVDEFTQAFRYMWAGGTNAGRENSARIYELTIDTDIIQMGVGDAGGPFADPIDREPEDPENVGVDIGLDFNITRPSVEQALIENAERARNQVTHRMTGDLANVLVEAHNDGLPIESRTGGEDIITRLQENVFPGIESWQAERIARTEVVSASNKGNLTAYQDASGVTGKKWLATDDNRTRPTHNHADNQIVLLGQPFIVGDHQAMYPGDPSLPPGERINCRCGLAPHVGM